MKPWIPVLFCYVFVMWISTQHLVAQRAVFVKGADASTLDQVEQSGGKYYDQGVEKDAISILKDHGFNLIRLKLWHTPSNQYNSLPNVLTMAKRIKAAGMSFMLDFHYSDTWADPGKQYKPQAWEGLSFDVLADSVYTYSKNVVAALKAQNTLPEYVQIGNEISCGMLWDDGKVCGGEVPPLKWVQLGTLVKQGIKGVNEAAGGAGEVKIIIHYDNGGNNGGCRWFFDNLLAQGVSFDIIGLSFYPWWHGTLTNLKDNLNDLSARYSQQLMVVEAAYPWTLGYGDNTGNIVGSSGQLHSGYPATVEGQTNYLSDLISTIRNTPADKGTGIVYWAPDWIPGFPGSPWENNALFDFDGEALESMAVFKNISAVDVKTDNEITINFSPNPFHERAFLSFTLHGNEQVSIKVYDTTSQFILSIANEMMLQGEHQIEWDTRSLPKGVYNIVFTYGNQKKVLRCVKI